MEHSGVAGVFFFVEGPEARVRSDLAAAWLTLMKAMMGEPGHTL